MKNLFKIFIQSMLFFVFIMLSNCSKDEFTNQIKNSKSKTDITLEQFKKETGLNNFKTTISIPKNINVIAKNADGTYELSDFNISTDKIKKVIINEKTTYTFQIETIDEKYGDRFFNLTLFYKDGWQSIIVELKPTTENLEQLKLGITEKFEGTLKLLYKSELTQNNMLGCTTVFITNWHCTGCTGPCDWCSLCVSSESYTMCGSEPVAAEPFFLDLGPSTIGGGPSDGTNTDTTNINSTTTNDEIAIETNISPNTITNNDGLSSNEFLIIQFFNSLSLEEQQWTIEHPNEYNNLINYLIADGFESKIEVQQIIEILTNNLQPEYDISNFPGKENDMPYEWWKNNEYISQNLMLFGQTPNALEVLLFSIFPEKAIFHIGNSNEALEKASQLVQNETLTGIHNGKADAFRHTYWNAMDSSEIGSQVTKLFTDAHEWKSGNNPLETQMDIFNNNIGRQIGETLNSNTPNSLIASIVLTYIQNGLVKYLTPLSESGEILSNTTLKPTNQ